MNDLRTSASIRAETDPRAGYTYFVRAGGLIKIGSSARPLHRLKGLKRQSPDLQIIKIVSGSVAGEFETHQKFDNLREHGEWFRVEPALLAFISELPAADLTPPAVPRREPRTPENPVLTALRGKIRREPEGVRKEQIEVMAAMIENRTPAIYLRR